MSKTVLWAGRHTLGSEQESALREIVGRDIVVENDIISWQSSPNESDDNEENALRWLELAARYDVVVGVFPPTAIIGLFMARGEADDGNEQFGRICQLKIYTPISEVSLVFGGTREKRLRFLRWQEV